MKKRLMPNYYSKLTCSCFLLVFVIVVVVAAYVLGTVNNARIASLKEEYDGILTEMIQAYRDVWDNHYKAFDPILAHENEKVLLEFCKGEGAGYERAERVNKVNDIFASVCKQDKWITGICFRRTVDNTSYLYLKKEGKIRNVLFEMNNVDVTQQLNRNLIGAREIGYQTGKQKIENARVFGIQSRVLSVDKKMANIGYQLTVLYGTDCFDAVLEKYHISPEAHFLVTTSQGLILYDSREAYGQGQDSFYEGIGDILARGDTFTADGKSYLKKAEATKKGDCFVFYTIPEKNVKGFRLEGMAGIVLLVAVIILVVMGTAMMAISRLIGRKFHELETGIRQIGMSDLKYRIPVKEQEDEFSQIAIQFNKMCDNLNTLIDKNYVYQVLQQKAEYQALKTSINPHFLYNSLEVMRELLTENGQDDLADAVLMLSRILDYQIHGDSAATIWMELEALQNYIDFSSARYRHNFEYSIDFENEILDYKIPKQIFQPIMENYFEHAFRGDGTDYISILGYADKEDDRIHICFCDNGKGFCKEDMDRRRILTDNDEEHVGLDNVYKRLQILFGEKCQVDIRSNAPDPGTSVILVFAKISTIDMG